MISQTTPILTNTYISYWKPKLNASVRLFCFPYAGGGASAYHAWNNHLPTDIEICPVQLPGRENRLREPAFDQLPALIPCLAEALLPYLDVSFAFFGHSMGALIAFELTHYLRRTYGISPKHLFISGRRAPTLHDPDHRIYTASDHEIIQELRQYKGTPEEIFKDPEMLALMLPLVRADFALIASYQYVEQPKLDIPISAFGGVLDHKAPRDTLAAWQELTSKAFLLRMFPGDHFFIRPAQARLLQIITEQLAGLGY